MRGHLLQIQQSTLRSKFAPKVFNHFSDEWHVILSNYVPFYAALNGSQQKYFQEKVLLFLNKVQLFPIGFELVDKDYLFVAASAVLPVYQLENWLYPQLNMVVLHNTTLGVFEDNQGNQMFTAGLFDYRRSPDKVHISRHVLWHDFIQDTPANVALHEFIHCIDFHDRYIDGIPLLLMEKEYIKPWVEIMLIEMKSILHNKSNINSYAGESKAEFLATVCEFYFKQPFLFQQKHPHLFTMMQKIFRHDV